MDNSPEAGRLTPAQEEVLATFERQIAEIEALPDDGYVLMWPGAQLFVLDVGDAVQATNLQRATVYQRGERYPLCRNGHDVLAIPIHRSDAKRQAIEVLRSLIEWAKRTIASQGAPS